MSNISFVWDPQKAESNYAKHGVTFGEAVSVFYDENALMIDDPDVVDDEERFVLLGLSAKLRLLVVCHCYRANDSTIRIISARKATRSESKVYRESK